MHQEHVATLERLSQVLRALLGGLLWVIGVVVSVPLLFVIVWFWVSVYFMSARPAEFAEPLVGLLTLIVVCVFSCWLLRIKQKYFPVTHRKMSSPAYSAWSWH
jgi:hypothetical protein